MDYFEEYKKSIFKRILKRVGVEHPLLIYLPYSMDEFLFFRDSGFKIIDLRKYLFRYSTNLLNYLSKRIGKIAKDREVILAGIDLLYRYYPRDKDIVLNILDEIMDSKTIVTFNDLEVLNLVSKHLRLGFLEVEEASLNLLWDYIDIDPILNLCEGSPTVYYMLSKNMHLKYLTILNKYLYRDSNIRLLLYYFTFYRGIGGIARVLGSQVGTYVNRLMKRGVLLRVGRKRAVYLIRDPLIRVVFTRIFKRGEDWHYAGFQYLIRKIFEGFKGINSISTADGEIYIGEPIKFQILEPYAFRMLDNDKVRYFIGMGYNLKKIDLLSKKYRKDKKLIIFKDTPNSRVRRSLKRKGFKVLTLQNIEIIAKQIGFTRGI